MSHNQKSVKRLPFFAAGLTSILVIGALLVTAQVPVAAASSGDLDPTFGNGGTVTTEFQVKFDSEAYASAVQADGKLLVAGSVGEIGSRTNFSMARYNIDGSLDATFGGTGRITANFSGEDVAYAVEVQYDGKILVAGAGNAPMSLTRSFTIVRYMPDGSRDASFGTGGVVTTSIGSSSYVVDLVIQSDSKIVAVGGTSSAQVELDFALARYMPDGSLDTSFGTGGIVTTDFANTRDVASAVAYQPDGMIVMVGSADTNFALARYMPDGNPDTSFGAGGKVVRDLGGTDVAKGATLASDGRIVVAGASGTFAVPTFIVARYLANGDPDPSFGNGGYVITNFDTYSSDANAVLLQPDGKIVAGGSATTQCGAPCISQFALARYLDNGDPDTSFGINGQVKTTVDPQYNYAMARALVLQADGKIAAAGYARSSSGKNYGVARYLPDGSLDVAFDGDGKLTTLFYGSNASAYSIALQADGKIIAAGPSASYCSGGYCTPNLFSLARYMPDGVLDPTFGAGGKVTTSFSRGEAQAYGVKVQPDGKIVVAGYAGSGTDGAFALARYMPDGSLDSSFSSDGMVVTDVNDTFRDAAFAMAIQADGKIIAAGYSSYEGVALARYMPDGSLDTSFSFDGILRTGVNNGYAYALSIALQSDGKILAGGFTARLCSTTCTNENFLLVRYMPNGDLDTAFGTNGSGGGIVITSFDTSSNDRVHSLALQPDGKIVAAGSVGIDCPDVCSSTDFGLARYLDDGSLDSNFGIGGLVTTDFAGGFDSIAGVVVQPDGKIVGAGRAGTIDYSHSFGLARYLSDGNLDSSFGTGGRVTTQVTPYGGEINAVVLSFDGKIVVAGEATLETAGKAFALARYENDVTCQAGVFIDVPSSSTFYTQITCLASRGIIGGYDDCTFRPYNDITRGQIAKVVANAAGFDEDPGAQIYEDVDGNNPFYQWINRLSRRGHMGGYPCGTVDAEPCIGPDERPYFRPFANATRGQLAKIVSNAAGVGGTPSGLFYTDVPEDNPFYLWIMRLTGLGVMGGYDCGGEGEPCDDQNRPYFRPQNNVTRGQASKIVANTFFAECRVMPR
jgi:uncharacterized delta-60 repeat protein